MRSRLAIALVLLAAISACGGDSKSDKAMASVCSARDDITKQVDTLAGNVGDVGHHGVHGHPADQRDAGPTDQRRGPIGEVPVPAVTVADREGRDPRRPRRHERRPVAHAVARREVDDAHGTRDEGHDGA